MKSHLILFVLLLLSSTVFGMEKEFETGKVNTESKIDSIRIMNNSNPKAVELNKMNENYTNADDENSIPWKCVAMALFIALIICIIIIIIMELTNNEKMKVLMENAEKKHLDRLDKSLEIQEKHLRAIIASNHKQEWLNEVRVSVANYLTNIAFIQPKVKSLLEADEYVQHVEKVIHYKSKIEILLTRSNCFQKRMLKAVNEFNEIMTMSKSEYKDDLFEEKRKKLLEATRVFIEDYEMSN